MEQTADLVLLGKVTKPHGIRGEIKVYPFSGEPENFLQYSRILLAPDEHGVPQSYTVKRARVQKNTVLLQLEECLTRNQAEELVNFFLYVYEDELPKPEPGEFYLRDLEGKQVVTEQGETLGTVHGILQRGVQDIVRVTNGQKEYLIPLVPEFLVALDNNRVTVSLPPGLLDINT